MKNKIFTFVKKQWLLIWLLLTSLSFVTIVVKAESVVLLSPMKRVLVTKDGHGLLFSSNLLDIVEEGEIEYQPAYKSGNGPYVVDLLLWNYDIKDEGSRYPEDINYELRTVLTDASGTPLTATDVGTKTVIIAPKSPSGVSITLSSENLSDKLESQNLIHSANGSTENSYTLTFPSGWDLEEDADICVQLTAVPTTKTLGGGYTDLATLGKIVGLRKSRATGSNGWDAVVNEKNNSNSPTSFDAYNLVVSGSGRATITISWDISKLEVNKNFYDDGNNVFGYTVGENAEVVDSGEEDGWYTVTINADTGIAARNNRNRYSLQLYKLGELDDDTYPADWNFFVKNSSRTASPNAWIIVNIE